MIAPSDDLKVIRELMEKSSKFISLSGYSGIVAGTTAIVGAWFASTFLIHQSVPAHSHPWFIIILAVFVASTSLWFALFFSLRRAKLNGHKLSKQLSLKILYHMGLPLLTGAAFSLILLLRGELLFALASTLVFYGLALINVSKYTLSEVHYLGIAEILIGILALILTSYSLWLWSVGFGAFHIIYGIIMYFRHDRKASQNNVHETHT